MRLAAEEIYRYALAAGFSPDQAVTMTAISLAESGGETTAHNAVGEDSIGLWQVNLDAHPRFAGADGTDPMTNAQMAFEVSGGGADIGRWTVTHADKGARYLHYRDEAEAAARANGYVDAQGQWDPPENYYSPKVGAGPAADGDVLVPGEPEDVVVGPATGVEPGGLDSDADGLVDQYEQAIGTDPNAADTDRDGFGDSVEVLHDTDPLDFSSNPLVAPTDAPPAFATPLTTTDTPSAPTAPTTPGTPGAWTAPIPAGPTTDAPAEWARPTVMATLSAGPDAEAGGGSLDTFIDAALSQDGAPYIFGEEVDLADPSPYVSGDAFDCSELVEWAAARAGVDVPDGSYNQYLELRDMGAELTVDEALQTPGALVFRFSSEPVPGGGRPSGAHVAISLGNGELIEARGRAYGVGRFDSADRDFTHAAFIPELGTELTPSLVGLDGEVVTEALPVIWDSDTDGLLDSYEKLISIDPFSVDTDRDGFLDSIELSYGSDPLDFANNPLVGEGSAAAYRPPLTTADAVPVGGQLVPDPQVNLPATGTGRPGVTVLPSADPVVPADELVDRSLDADPTADPAGDGFAQPDDADATVDGDDDQVDDDDDVSPDDP